jgi:small subunit ribosomal protein S1
MTTRQEYSEDTNNENFEEMLEQSMNRRDDFAVGTRVNGKVVYTSDEFVFVDISGKSEAVIGASEFRKDDGSLSVKTGDTIDGYVVSLTGGEIHLTTSIGRGSMNPGLMQMAYQESIPVYGTIQDTVKGGYSISVGGIRCFCPVSQIDLRTPPDLKALINKSFLFKIIEFKERGKNIILSRSALLEEQRKETESHLKATLKPGDRITGKISGVRDFGIFVDIGGMEALIPKSELSRSRHSDMDAFKTGDTIEAAVKSVDWDSKRLTLSIKDLMPEPWDHIGDYEPGQTIAGLVVNIIKNGAFVEIEPGLDGFLHVSRMSFLKKINRPEEAVSTGSRVNVRIVSINPGEKKISLELVPNEPDPWKEPGATVANQVQMVTVEDVKPAGLNVRLANGMLGFIPRGELKTKSEAEIQKKYSEGDQLRASVLRIEQDNRKLIMSETEALRMEERSDYENFIKKDASSQSTSLGSLLKNKFEDIQKKMDR